MLRPKISMYLVLCRGEYCKYAYEKVFILKIEVVGVEINLKYFPFLV